MAVTGFAGTEPRAKRSAPQVIIVAFASVSLLLFAPAGRLNWPAAWLWLSLVFGGALVVLAHVRRRNPGLAERRLRSGPGTPSWDRIIVTGLRLSFVGVIVVSALDRGRYGWSSPVWWLSALGAVLMSSALVGIGWSMGANPHFETTVRIQGEVGHRVIDRGPYRFVRHPGYVSLALLWLGSALMLGSRWALIPAGVGVLVLLLRTALEDRFLNEQLAGYVEYAGRVRYRFVPLLW